MAIEGIYRYNELIGGIIGGDFYKSGGMVLPYRSGLTEIRLETSAPNTEHGIFINDAFSGTVTTDADGNAVFKRHFDRGEVVLKLINHVSGRKLLSWLTIREYAIWLSSYAEVFEIIDDNIQETQDDLSIGNVTINGIEDHFGEAIKTYNNLGQDLDVYRQMVHELRLGYRNYGALFRGLETGVAQFTQVPPFGYSRRMWGPNWFLDHSMVMNHRFKERSNALSTTGNITGVSMVGVEVDCEPDVLHALDYNNVTNELTWSPNGVAGTPVTANSGELFLPGRDYQLPAYMLGLAGPFNIIITTNDRLYLNIDDLGTIIISITVGGAVALATIVTDINNALVADVRYGAPYAAFASVYNLKLLLRSPSVAGSNIVVEPNARNAAPTLLGIKSDDIVFAPNITNGIVIKKIEGSPSFIGNATLEYEYDGGVVPVTRRLRWKSPTAAFSPWIPITDSGNFVLTDSLSVELYVNCMTDLMDDLPAAWPAVEVHNFTLGYMRTSRHVGQTKGLWVLCDSTLLPAAPASDTITIVDDTTSGFDETPDNWWVETTLAASATFMFVSGVIKDKADPLDPNSAFMWYIDNLGNAETSIEIRTHALKWPMPRPGPRGSNFPQRSNGLLYDYEGYEAKFSAWFFDIIPGGVATTITLGFSFDDGTTWVNGPPTAIIKDSQLAEVPTYVEFETIIPAAVTDNGILVRAVADRVGGTIAFAIDAPNITVDNISSTYLGDTTLVRSRHRQYFGELVWLWAPEALSLTEKEYLGLRHKRASMVTPLSGITITHISEDTPAGTGTIEYEYNNVGDTHRLRWKTYGSSYGAWVPVVSDGSYTLTSFDSSTITVQVTYSLLLVLSGTPPAATTDRDITITDETINQGHARRMSAANSSIDLLDVTEYDSNGVPTNLFGVIDEADFSICGLINSDIQPADPFKESYVYPEFLSQEDELLSFAPVGPNWKAFLDFHSDQDQLEAVLFEDDLEVPNDRWYFLDDNEIIMTSGYSGSAIYTISYNLIYQVTTSFIDLSANSPLDHIYFADYFLWDRLDKNLDDYENTLPLFFNPNNGRAAIRERSNMNTSESTLVMQDGTREVTVAQRYWRFVDSKTIELDLSQLVDGAQYVLTHMEERVYATSSLTVVFEHKSGATSIACNAASWNQIERNENIRNDHDFHQLRLSISGIRDLSDFKIRSMVLKGLHAFGANAWVPGLTEPA